MITRLLIILLTCTAVAAHGQSTNRIKEGDLPTTNRIGASDLVRVIIPSLGTNGSQNISWQNLATSLSTLTPSPVAVKVNGTTVGTAITAIDLQAGTNATVTGSSNAAVVTVTVSSTATGSGGTATNAIAIQGGAGNANTLTNPTVQGALTVSGSGAAALTLYATNQTQSAQLRAPDNASNSVVTLMSNAPAGVVISTPTTVSNTTLSAVDIGVGQALFRTSTGWAGSNAASGGGGGTTIIYTNNSLVTNVGSGPLPTVDWSGPPFVNWLPTNNSMAVLTNFPPASNAAVITILLHPSGYTNVAFSNAITGVLTDFYYDRTKMSYLQVLWNGTNAHVVTRPNPVGGIASNAIANSSGLGTNTTFYGTTINQGTLAQVGAQTNTGALDVAGATTFYGNANIKSATFTGGFPTNTLLYVKDGTNLAAATVGANLTLSGGTLSASGGGGGTTIYTNNTLITNCGSTSLPTFDFLGPPEIVWSPTNDSMFVLTNIPASTNGAVLFVTINPSGYTNITASNAQVRLPDGQYGPLSIDRTNKSYLQIKWTGSNAIVWCQQDTNYLRGDVVAGLIVAQAQSTATKQHGSGVLSNIVGLSSTTFTNVPRGGTNTAVRTAGGTNFIDTTGELNNWAQFSTNQMSNAVAIAAGSGVTVQTNSSGGRMVYTVAAAGGGGSATNAIGNSYGFGTNTTLLGNTTNGGNLYVQGAQTNDNDLHVEGQLQLGSATGDSLPFFDSAARLKSMSSWNSNKLYQLGQISAIPYGSWGSRIESDGSNWRNSGGSGQWVVWEEFLADPSATAINNYADSYVALSTVGTLPSPTSSFIASGPNAAEWGNIQVPLTNSASGRIYFKGQNASQIVPTNSEIYAVARVLISSTNVSGDVSTFRFGLWNGVNATAENDAACVMVNTNTTNSTFVGSTTRSSTTFFYGNDRMEPNRWYWVGIYLPAEMTNCVFFYGTNLNYMVPFGTNTTQIPAPNTGLRIGWQASRIAASSGLTGHTNCIGAMGLWQRRRVD